MFKDSKRHTIDVLFVITLFAVFAMSIMVLTGIGASVYEKIQDSMSENYDSRTAFSYISNKIHQNDTNGNISLGTYGGTDAVIISEEIDNVTYCTYLYCCDGYLKELFTRAGQEFDLEYGTNILELDSFSASYETDTLIRFELKPKDADKETVFVHISSQD
jgi:hypothetical protein